jgi:hypothetical protein
MRHFRHIDRKRNCPVICPFLSDYRHIGQHPTMPSTADMNETELASLLCSRLCHDLLSPIGAMNNGLELLADETDPEMRARCIELLSDSARASANKLKFFRLAFGAAGGFGDKVDVSEPRQLIEGLVADKPRVEMQWARAQRHARQARGQGAPQPRADRAPMVWCAAGN